jgi:hypothetical protein
MYYYLLCVCIVRVCMCGACAAYCSQKSPSARDLAPALSTRRLRNVCAPGLGSFVLFVFRRGFPGSSGLGRSQRSLSK